MPDEPGQEPNDSGQESQDPNERPESPQAPGQDPKRQDTFDADYVRTLRKENANWRKKAEAAEAKVQEHEQAKLSETEKLTARLTELEQGHQGAQTALQEARLENAVLVAAHKAGAVDTDAVYRLLDREGVEFDSQGRPHGVEAAVKALLKERPYLARTTGSADGGAGNGNGRQGGGLDLDTQIRRAMGR
jgi:transposase